MGDVLEFKPRARPAALPPNEKRDALRRLMELGIAQIHLDARKPGVVVPPQFATDYRLRLNLSWRYRIHDLDFGAEKVVATLSFSGRPFRCEVPWSAIFAVTNPEHREACEVYLKDLPAELVKTEPLAR